MNSICLIPARGGSKRIPRKNIKMFHGKPLIAWSIEVAKSSGLFKEVYVSTDDKEIATIAEKYGANIPFLRPDNLSDEYAVDKDVRDHFIEWLKENLIEADILCYLYATAPFICHKTLKECQKLLLKSGFITAHTVTKYDYPIFRSLKRDESGLLSFVWDEYSSFRSQDLPEIFHDAGQCYFFNLKKYGGKETAIGYEIPSLYCKDIDTFEDFEMAEKLFPIVRSSFLN